jgi:hypothetical protein
MATASMFLMGIGWSGHVMFAQQIGLPRQVEQNTSRIHNLEDRMVGAEQLLQQVEVTGSRVDSLYVLVRDTYCIVRADHLGLDPLATCTLGRDLR